MKGFLEKEERAQLLIELKLEKRSKFSDRIKVILLLDEGKTYQSIADHLFIDDSTIRNYRKRYKEGGLEGLVNDDYSGRMSQLSPSQQNILIAHLKSKICISANEVRDFVDNKFRVDYSIRGVIYLLHRLGFTYKKAKGAPGNANKKDQAAFVKFYDALKGKGKIYFADSTHPQHNPVLSYGWIKKGEDFEVLTNTGRFHLNINGAVDIKNLDVVTRSCDWVNASSICDLLKAIREKNPSMEKVFVVMDNAPYNRSAKVIGMSLLLNIELIYLPPYSPNLNPIERFWKFFKKKVLYNKYYPTKDEFIAACTGFFRTVRRFEKELSTLLTDNFRIMGT